jgi:O-antigen/teichoic acid export membrane protein
MLDKYLTQVLLLVTMAIMARILTPAETGLFLVAQAFIILAENFRDFGVSAYLIQERNLSRDVLRSSFTVTMLLSWSMAIAIYLGAGEIAVFYGEPGLEPLLLVATIGFLFIPFGSTIIALLRREMAFQTLAWMNVAAAAVGSCVTVTLALAGVGAMSYVWGSVATGFCMTLMALAVRPQFWMFVPSLRRSRGLFSFGSIAVLGTVVNIAYDLMPRLVLGRILGFDAVGLFGRAVTICQLPDRFIVSALHPVVLPAMAAHARAGFDLKTAYLRGHQLMSGVQWPILLMLALLADPVVRIVLGPQWGAVPPLVRVMAVATMALAPAFMTYPVLVAVGRIRDTLYASLISLPPSALAILLAAPHGLDAVTLTLLLTCPLQMFVALLFIRRAIGLRFGELLEASRSSIVITCGTAAVPVLIVALSPTGFVLDWVHAGLALVGGVVGWLAAIWMAGSPLKEEILRLWRRRLAAPGNEAAMAAGGRSAPREGARIAAPPAP